MYITIVLDKMTEQEIDIYYKTVLDLVSLAGKVSQSTFIYRLKAKNILFVVSSVYDNESLRIWSIDFGYLYKSKRKKIFYRL